MRSGTASLQQLWQCPQGQHLTALRAPPAQFGVLNAAGVPPPADHLLAAAVSTGVRGGGSQVLLFDLRRPALPVASWEQPGMDRQWVEPASLLRWAPAPPAEPAGPSGSQTGTQADEQRWGGLVVAGSSDSGRVMGCQYTAAVSGPALLARQGGITEKPAGGSAVAALLGRLQVALQQQEAARKQLDLPHQPSQQQQQEDQQEADALPCVEHAGRQHMGDSTGSMGGARLAQERELDQQPSQSAASAVAAARSAADDLVPQELRAPPPLPTPLQLLWQPAHTLVVTPLRGPPLLLAAPTDQQPALSERLLAGRVQLQRQQAAGGAIKARGARPCEAALALPVLRTAVPGCLCCLRAPDCRPSSSPGLQAAASWPAAPEHAAAGVGSRGRRLGLAPAAARVAAVQVS